MRVVVIDKPIQGAGVEASRGIEDGRSAKERHQMARERVATECSRERRKNQEEWHDKEEYTSGKGKWLNDG
jgi:hypothetical protein